jgi:hypothetical protein
MKFSPIFLLIPTLATLSLANTNWTEINEICGVSHTDRIIGGTKAALGQYPWIAHIGLLKKERGTHKLRWVNLSTQFVANSEREICQFAPLFSYECGGSLVHPRFVASAAHCVHGLLKDERLWVLGFDGDDFWGKFSILDFFYNYSNIFIYFNFFINFNYFSSFLIFLVILIIFFNFTVSAIIKLGEHNLETDIDCEGNHCADPPQVFYPERVIVPREYNETTLKHDLALIELDEPAQMSQYVLPVCLPSGDLMKNDLMSMVVEVVSSFWDF